MMFDPKSAKKILLSLSVASLATSCSNSTFKSQTKQNAESPAAASEDAQAGNPVQSSAIGTSDGSLPGILNSRPDSLFVSLPTVSTQDAKYKFILDLKEVATDFKLENINSPKTENFSQNTRSPITQTFKQGTPGQHETQNFDQLGRKGLVDILVIIDNSGSMAQEQTNLAAKMNELLVSIKDTPWQISVITTTAALPAGIDMNTPESEGKELCNTILIKAGDADAATKFAAAVNAGILGSGNEQGVRQAVVGLRCTEKPWLRPTASLAVLIVADEDNCSANGADCGTLKWAKETYLLEYLETTLKRTIGKDTGLYGIFSPPAMPCATAYNVGTQYQKLADFKANGMINFGNICDTSYKATLNKISDNIALLLTSQFELKSQPDAGTLKLVIKTAAGVETPVPSTAYSLAGKVITFVKGEEPTNGSKLIATYVVGAKPLFDAVTLGNDPAPGTLVVKINAAAVAAGAYTISGRQLTFITQPPATADIMVDYRLNTPLFDRVRLTQVPLDGTLSVKVNNVATNNFSYNPATGEVVLGQIPLDGQAIVPSYTFKVGPKLAYQLPLMPGGKNFKLQDGGNAITFVKNNDVITITAPQHEAGKKLSLIYEVPDGANRVFALGNVPLPNSAKLEMIVGSCALGSGITITGADLVANCPVTTKSEFNLLFQYRVLNRVYKVAGIPNAEIGSWAVYYNGELNTDFIRKESTITLNFDPELDSTIDIRYTYPE